MVITEYAIWYEDFDIKSQRQKNTSNCNEQAQK